MILSILNVSKPATMMIPHNGIAAYKKWSTTGTIRAHCRAFTLWTRPVPVSVKPSGSGQSLISAPVQRICIPGAEYPAAYFTHSVINPCGCVSLNLHVEKDMEAYQMERRNS